MNLQCRTSLRRPLRQGVGVEHVLSSSKPYNYSSHQALFSFIYVTASLPLQNTKGSLNQVLLEDCPKPRMAGSKSSPYEFQCFPQMGMKTLYLLAHVQEEPVHLSLHAAEMLCSSTWVSVRSSTKFFWCCPNSVAL